MRKFFRITLLSLALLIVMVVAFVSIFFSVAPQVGQSADGARLEKMKLATNYHDGKFWNLTETSMDMSAGEMVRVTWDVLTGDPVRKPAEPLETRRLNPVKWDSVGRGNIGITWFGHSSMLIKIEGRVFLTDPMFSDRASMFSFAGPERFAYTHSMTADSLPAIDAVLISHDHYDHLDYNTIVALKDKVKHFFVPLGVGAHLERWGVPASSITELNWWESVPLDDTIEITSAPSRHFSGRGLTNRMSTLWTSWVIKGRFHRIYFSGDTGYSPSFKEIGDKYGPFNVTLMECGQYNTKWKDIHMTPEQTVQAHRDLKGEVLIPMHWGKFNLALHPWKEPVTRLEEEASRLNVTWCTPMIGETVIVPGYLPHKEWWKNYR